MHGHAIGEVIDGAELGQDLVEGLRDWRIVLVGFGVDEINPRI
jgi:hypothetical protein